MPSAVIKIIPGIPGEREKDIENYQQLASTGNNIGINCIIMA